VTKGCFLIPALLCLAFIAQGLWFIGTQSLTFDEPVHMVSGLEIWKYGRFARWNDHPPLSRALFGLPLLGRNWQIDFNYSVNAWNDHSPKAFMTWGPEDPKGMAWHARPMNLLLGAALGILLWFTARRLYSTGAANVVLLLFAFSPGLIAHFSLATTDGAGVLMIFAAAAQLARWRNDPSRFQTVLLGVVLGGTLVAKFYTVPMFLLALMLVIVSRAERRWRNVIAIAGIAFVVAGATYLYHISWLTLENGRLFVQAPDCAEYKLATLNTTRSFAIPIPAGEYVTGLIDVYRHGRWGHPSFFLGDVSPTGGWKLYYPVLMVLKWPTIVLLVAICVLVLTVKRRIVLPRDLLVMLAFPALFLLFSIFSKLDIGDRHILPVYPFVLLLCGGIWEVHRRSRLVFGLILLALGLHITDVMRYAPDYLSYFNPFVDSRDSYLLLSDSNVDWGQGLIALQDYQASHPDEQIHLAYFGSVYPRHYGIDAKPLCEDERTTGTVVVSATHLSGQLLRRPKSYRWLLQYPRVAILNHSLHVFRVPAEAPQKAAH
jgi:hypothetical protein